MNLRNKTIGHRIRFFRRKLGLTQRELAKRCGVHQTALGFWERSAHWYPKPPQISALCETLNITPEILINGDALLPIRPACDSDDPRNLIGGRIRFRRKELGMTQTQLAEAVGVHYTTVSHHELGKGKNRSVDDVMLNQYAEALDVGIDYFHAPEAEQLSGFGTGSPQVALAGAGEKTESEADQYRQHFRVFSAMKSNNRNLWLKIGREIVETQ